MNYSGFETWGEYSYKNNGVIRHLFTVELARATVTNRVKKRNLRFRWQICSSLLLASVDCVF